MSPREAENLVSGASLLGAPARATDLLPDASFEIAVTGSWRCIMSRALLLTPAFASLLLLLGVPTLAAPPPAPGGVAAAPAACTDMQLTWSDVAGETIYIVYRDGSPIPIAFLPADATTYTDVAPPGNTHTYCIVASNDDGDSPSSCATGSFATSSMTVENKNWFQDTFTANETIAPIPPAPYDTTSAWIRTGLNLAAYTGDISRQDLPGDTVVCEAAGSSLRLDLVFRILPGVGNYVTIGNRASALRRVPTATTAAAPNAASANFWESYLADNGALGTGGNGTTGPGHPGGVWDPNRWNSARCDTAETNLFPVAAVGNLPGIVPGRYASMYHEADPKYVTLGVPKKRCFLINPAGAINSTNITCGSGTYPPPWAAGAGLSPSEGGLAPGVTHEFSQIIPDGQLTPGAHIEYFLRTSDESAPLTPLGMNPDTSFVVPQPGCNRDCLRWAHFSVLPDRWKDSSFGGSGMAEMLVVNLDDGRSDECAWASVADSVGITSYSRRGANNGWGRVPAGTDVNDPAYFVRSHGGQPGTCWDYYTVRGSRDTLTGNAGGLGGRLAPRCIGCPSAGRESRQGPTGLTMRTFYRLVLFLSGGRNVAILGPSEDRGQDDVTMLQDYVINSVGTAQPRGVWVMGSGFGESESTRHPSFFTQTFGATLRGPDYAALSGNSAASVALTVPIPPPNRQYGLLPHSLDVLNVNPVVPTAIASGSYENVGSLGPYVGSVSASQGAGRPF